MKTKVLFPMLFGELDPSFELECNALSSVGVEYFMFDHDLLVSEGKVKTNITHSEEKVGVILRGWMLTDKQYEKLYDQLIHKNYWLINTPMQYVHCHYFPNVYQDLKELTPPISSFFIEDLSDELLSSILKTTKNFIIKDFVKSEKGTDLFKINSDISVNELKEKIYKFVEQRQPLFNKGIVLKDFENLKQYHKTTNEWRAFFYKGFLVSLEPNSNQQILIQPQIKDVLLCGARVSNHTEPHSLFFTLDFAELEDGSWIVLEAGDGQVSGLAAGQNELKFYGNLLKIINQDENKDGVRQ